MRYHRVREPGHGPSHQFPDRTDATMDGLKFPRQLASLTVATTLALGACAEVDPKPAPVPFSLYDSPVIAGGIPDDETAGRKTPAKRNEEQKVAGNDEPLLSQDRFVSG